MSNRDRGVQADYLDRAFKTRVGAVDSSGRIARLERAEKRRASRTAAAELAAMQRAKPLKPPPKVVT